MEYIQQSVLESVVSSGESNPTGSRHDRMLGGGGHLTRNRWDPADAVHRGMSFKRIPTGFAKPSPRGDERSPRRAGAEDRPGQARRLAEEMERLRRLKLTVACPILADANALRANPSHPTPKTRQR